MAGRYATGSEGVAGQPKCQDVPKARNVVQADVLKPKNPGTTQPRRKRRGG